MTPLMLRQLWSLIETTQTQILLTLDDTSLVHWLLRRLKQERSLDYQETHLLQNYLQTKLSLIRDLAEERMAS